MPLDINLPTDFTVGESGHVTGHEATNTAVNATAAVVDALGVDPVPAPTGVAATDRAVILSKLASAAPGSTVQLGPGTYLTDQTIPVPDHVALAGTIANERVTYGSIIKAANGSNLDAVIADASWYNNSTGVGDVKSIANLQVDGNASNQTSGAGIGVVGMSYRFRLHNVTVSNTRGDGIRLTNVARNGTEATGTAVEPRIENCIISDAGLADLSNNNDSFAIREGSTGNSVTDGWLLNCAILGETATTKGCGARLSQCAGWVVQGNHIYGVGSHGIYLTATGYTRVVGNYVEHYGQRASLGNVHGIYVKDSGTSGTSLVGNTINAVQGVTGNTFYGMYLENVSASAAYYAMGANTFFSSSSSTGTAIRAVNNGSNNNFKIAYTGQTINGFLTALSIDPICNFQGQIGGYQPGPASGTYTADLGRGSTVEFNLTGNVTITLPTSIPSGIEFTLIFNQDATGGRTVTFDNSNPGVGQFKTAWTPNTAANKVNIITLVSDGYWIYQKAATVGL